MAFTLLQAGTSLYTVNTGGGVSSALTLPTGTTLSQYRRPRFAKFNRYIVVVNTPSKPLSVDVAGVVRPLVPDAPLTTLTLSGVTGGTLSGTYRARQTYVILDTLGNVISESDYGPDMDAAVTIASQYLHADSIAISSETISARRLYRTTSGGASYFKWTTLDGNSHISIEDDASDASLGLIAGPELGSAPDLTLICEWQGRLWGVDRIDIDNLRYTTAGTMYGWSALNTIPIQHVGADSAGCTALIPRRNALGVGRRNTLMQVTGTSRTNFTAVVVPGGEGRGVVSQESVVIDADIAYFLWQDGVYTWDSTGIHSLSDTKVSAWFGSDTYFNRAMFHRATAQLVDQKYRLFLASPGSTQLDRWIEYDFRTKTWWGIHRTNAFTPTCTLPVAGADGQVYPMVGNQEGFVVQEQDDANDLHAVAIPVSAVTKAHAGGDPESEKVFGELSIWGKGQATGSITVTPSVGTLAGQVDLAPFDYDMTLGRHRVGRVGVGQHATLTFTHDTINEPVELYGYTINPVSVVDRR